MNTDDLINGILEKFGLEECWREVTPDYKTVSVRMRSVNGLEAVGIAILNDEDADMATEKVGAYIAVSRAILQIVNNSLSTGKIPEKLTKKEAQFVYSGKLSASLKLDLRSFIEDKEVFYKRIRMQRENKTGVKVRSITDGQFKEIQKRMEQLKNEQR